MRVQSSILAGCCWLILASCKSEGHARTSQSSDQASQEKATALLGQVFCAGELPRDWLNEDGSVNSNYTGGVNADGTINSNFERSYHAFYDGFLARSDAACVCGFASVMTKLGATRAPLVGEANASCAKLRAPKGTTPP